MTDFFAEFDAERWHFTYVDETSKNLPVQQVGIVAIFHLVDAYTPSRRQGISEAFSLYHALYGEKLKGGYRGDKRMVVRPFSKMGVDAYLDYAVNTHPANAIEFSCMSTLSLRHASDYEFGVFSPADWYERTHKRVSTVQIYLPVEELLSTGKAQFESFLLKCCTLLRPLHGAAGLGMQDCHDWENYQSIGHETAWSYRGVDLCPPTGNKRWRNGYTNLNWYTFLARHWITKLGPPEQLQASLNDDRIVQLPYEWGTVIRAGDWPALGKASVDPQPELYCKVSNAIRSLRVKDIGSLHYGCIDREVRLNPLTSNLWLRRFDPPEELRAVIEAANASAEPHLVRMPSGLPCPWPGRWLCEEVPALGSRTFNRETLLPQLDGQEVTWRLLEAH